MKIMKIKRFSGISKGFKPYIYDTNGEGEPINGSYFQIWSFLIHSANRTIKAMTNPMKMNAKAGMRPCRFTKAGLRIPESIA